MLEFVRQHAGELFGAGGLFQQASQNHQLAAGSRKGIDAGIVHHRERDPVRRRRMRSCQRLHHLVDLPESIRIPALLRLRGELFDDLAAQ